ncbi:MAG TPA: glycosyl transferase, partial [Bacteroidales bacterium]|nr:glycosyl transferase [Bacteroidales bacterium]
MKIAIIGTYPPRRCGIGTFTHNLAKAIIQNTNDRNIADRIMIAAVTEDDAEYEYPEEVQIIIRQNQQNDYIRAANSIN